MSSNSEGMLTKYAIKQSLEELFLLLWQKEIERVPPKASNLLSGNFWKPNKQRLNRTHNRLSRLLTMTLEPDTLLKTLPSACVLLGDVVNHGDESVQDVLVQVCQEQHILWTTGARQNEIQSVPRTHGVAHCMCRSTKSKV